MHSLLFTLVPKEQLKEQTSECAVDRVCEHLVEGGFVDFRDPDHPENYVYQEKQEIWGPTADWFMLGGRYSGVLNWLLLTKEEQENPETKTGRDDAMLMTNELFDELKKGIVQEHQLNSIGLNAGDIFAKLIKNGWAQEVSPRLRRIRLTMSLEQEMQKMREIFGDDFPKVLSVLQDAQEHINGSVFNGWAVMDVHGKPWAGQCMAGKEAQEEARQHLVGNYWVVVIDFHA
jgi:hypothetical protein